MAGHNKCGGNVSCGPGSAATSWTLPPVVSLLATDAEHGPIEVFGGSWHNRFRGSSKGII